MTFDASGKCPICGHGFKSDNCPHSFGQAQERLHQNKENKRIEKLVKTMVDKALKERGLIQ